MTAATPRCVQTPKQKVETSVTNLVQLKVLINKFLIVHDRGPDVWLSRRRAKSGEMALSQIAVWSEGLLEITKTTPIDDIVVF